MLSRNSRGQNYGKKGNSLQRLSNADGTSPWKEVAEVQRCAKKNVLSITINLKVFDLTLTINLYTYLETLLVSVKDVQTIDKFV